MDTVLPQEKLREVFGQITQDITQKVAGVRLYQGNAPPSDDLCTVYAAFERGFTSSLSLCAETALFVRLTQHMLQSETVTDQDVEDFSKEYFNVLCGYVASALYRVSGVASRFGIPDFHRGRFRPPGFQDQFVLSYFSDRDEPAWLTHYTTNQEACRGPLSSTTERGDSL